jgi:phosphoenolpyruvate carboxylase
MNTNYYKFDYYKKYLDKTIKKINELIIKDNLSDADEKELSSLIYNAEYFLLICSIYDEINHVSNTSTI